MISDNFVTGDNVYLNELKNFFFEVLGMMSITHYGCIGDGRYDNYGPLQVAIEDAHRRGLKYIYVPSGRYRYRGNLLHLEGITFMGNSHAKIYNDKTGVMIPIVQFALGNNSLFETEYTYMLNRDFYIDLSGEIGDRVSLIPIPGQNVAYYYAPIRSGEKYEFSGKGTMARLNNECEIAFKYDFESSDPEDVHWFTPTEDGIFVISYTDTNNYEPHLWHRYWWTTEEIVDDDNKIPTSGAVYRALQETQGGKNIITACLTTDYTPSNGYNKLPFSDANYCGDKLTLDGSGNILIGNGVTEVMISGNARFSQSSTNTSEKNIHIFKNNVEIAYSGTTSTDTEAQVTISNFLVPVETGDSISLQVQFFNEPWIVKGSTIFETYLTVEAVGYEHSGPEPGPEEDEMRKLTESVALVDGTIPPFEEGFYYTANNNITVNGNTVFGTNEILYYDANRTELAGSLKVVSYSNNAYFVGLNSMIETTLSQSNSKIPTSSAVYNAINT